MKRNVIGVGNTATVYEWEDGKVIKLFKAEYPKEAIQMEYQNAKAIENLDFHKPKAHGIVEEEGKLGIIYDRIDGEYLLDWVLKTGDLKNCALYMAGLHKTILQNNIDDVPDYKGFLIYFIDKAVQLSAEKRKEVLDLLENLPNGSTLCHGDLHPGNIFFSEGKTTVIDYMNICHGPYLYDVARTVYLVQYTPIPEEVPDKEAVREFKKALADSYLMYMNVARDMIEDYLTVIKAARLGECPGEHTAM